MSDLHQYEIRYNIRDGQETSNVFTKIALEWAYTVQEACFQLEQRLRRSLVILESGPVKAEIAYRNAPNLPNLHFHVCQGCQKVVTCPGCFDHARSDFWEPCYECNRKKAGTQSPA